MAKESDFDTLYSIIRELPSSQLKKTVSELDDRTAKRILVRALEKRRRGLDSMTIPLSIFKDRKHGFLEATVQYLKDTKGLSNSQISKTLRRSSQVVWTSLHKSRKKGKLSVKECDYDIYLSDLRHDLSIFESITLHLKERFQMTYKDIANILGRSTSTINTIYNRAKKKQ